MKFSNLLCRSVENEHNDELANEDNSFSSSEFDKCDDADTYKETVRNKVWII